MVVDIAWTGMDGINVTDECLFFNEWSEVLKHVTFLEEHGAQMITVYYEGEEVDYNVSRNFTSHLSSI
jgi:hypothetical protein